MVRNIFKARIEIDKFSSGDSRLFVEFADAKGQERGELQWTPNPDNPVNFWHYTPQGGYDRAPIG